MSDTHLPPIHHLADVVNRSLQQAKAVAGFPRPYCSQELQPISQVPSPPCSLPQDSSVITSSVPVNSLVPLDVITSTQNASTAAFSIPLPFLCQAQQVSSSYQATPRSENQSIHQLNISNTDSNSLNIEHEIIAEAIPLPIPTSQSSGISTQQPSTLSQFNNLPIDANLLQSLAQSFQLAASTPTTNNVTLQDSPNLQPCPSPFLQITSQFCQNDGPVSKQNCSVAETNNQNFSCRLAVASPLTFYNSGPESLDKDTNSASSSCSAIMTLANMSVLDMLLKNHTENSIEKNTPIIPLIDEKQVTLPATEVDDDSEEAQVLGQYCAECNSMYEHSCKHHITQYNHVLDTAVLSRAKMSVPQCLLLQDSFVQPSSTGVWTRFKLMKHTKFGPLIGKRYECVEEAPKIKKEKIIRKWKVFLKSRSFEIDVSDENECNWMIFVQPAPIGLEQNMVAYQEGQEIYFVSIADIDPNQELLFWYSKNYASQLGVPQKPPPCGGAAQCHVCEHYFPDKKSMLHHRKQIHPEVTTKKWKCSECEKRFPSLAKLNKHYLCHIDVKPQRCDICNKQFTEKGNLNKHLKIHRGEKDFECGICKKKYRQKVHLDSHMVCHTGEKNLKCQYCGRCFARKADMKHHEYIHTKELVLKCPHCPGIFHKKQNYKRHLLIHNNERNFVCSMCKKAFYQKYHLNRHQQTCKFRDKLITSL